VSNIKTYANASKSNLIFRSLVTGEDAVFYAFLSSFNQSFASDWSSELVYGRTDPIGNFQGTQRTISAAWDLPAGNVDEAKENLLKVNKLVKMLYPAYATAQQSVEIKEGEGTKKITVGGNALVISKPPLMRLRFSNLIKSQGGTPKSGRPGPASIGLLGWIGNLTWTPDLAMGMFSLNQNLYPKVISLSIDFTVQHEHTIGKTPGKSTPAKFPFGG